MPTLDSVRLGPAQRRAVEVFLNGGCVRTPNEDRLEEGYRSYKKGWEIRFTLRSKPEVSQLRLILQDAGLDAGSSYRKRERTWILPVYGRDQVTRFLRWVDETENR